MSVFSQLFNVSTGNLVKDPQRMAWGVALDTMIGVGYIDSPSTNATYKTYAITSAGFWTAMAAAGDVSTVSVDDTYVTVTDITGNGGVLTHLVLPGFTAGADIATARITVDGVVYTLAFTADNAGDRIVAGPLTNVLIYGGPGNSPGVWGGSGLVSGLAFRYEGSTEATKQGLILGTPSVALGGYPCVSFDSTLKVEMKCSDFSSTTNRDDCAAIYVLNQY